MNNMDKLKKYAFDDIELLIAYLYTLKEDISPIKLQKGLYFLYAFYAGLYFKTEGENNEYNDGYDFPNELFEANFEAWNYGPVIRDVYTKRKNGRTYYLNISKSEKFKQSLEEFKREPYGNNVLEFVEGAFETIAKKTDFDLVDRSHEDKVWREAYKNEYSNNMKSEDIIQEYIEKFRKAAIE